MAKKGNLMTVTPFVGGVEFAIGTAVKRFHFDQLSPELSARALAHGLTQKIADGAAIPRSTVTGLSATDAEKQVAMTAIADRLLPGGEWNATSRGPTGLSAYDLAVAISRLKNCPLSAAMDAVSELPTEKRQALAKNPRLVATIATIRAERLLAGGDAGDDDLDGLLLGDGLGDGLAEPEPTAPLTAKRGRRG
jgi:hypothetical protein